MNRFELKLHAGQIQLRRGPLQTLQINLGRKCNQACRHCHVDAAPWRTEMMSRPVARRIGQWIARYRPATVDLTGGAPELHPEFRYFVELSRTLGLKVMDRNNLTILEEAGFEWLAPFLAAHRVEVMASLPCYLEENVNRQRGNGVFARSIRALRKLNALGYGTSLPLHLVYNPLGPTLPPPQDELELEYKQALRDRYGIVFNQLFTITNQPIARFAQDLRGSGRFEEYMELLETRFNPATTQGLMCRSTLSVGHEGEVFDCDFNQMLSLRIQTEPPLFLWDLRPEQLENSGIRTGDHCLACAAGCGSSCTGALAA